MAETFYIYTIDDLSPNDPSILTDGSFLVEVASGASPDFIRVSDGDSFLDTLATGDSDQVLSADLVIDGVTVGTAGEAVSIGTESGVTNFSGGFSTGTFSTIIVDGVVVGFVSTIELSPGDALSVDPASGGSAIDYGDFAACFTRDTKIMCERGEVPVQDLQCGDLVVTRTAGLQPIRWVGSQKAKGRGALTPVRFKVGALDNTGDILVSPMHRMLVSGPRAELLFGAPELLAYAKDLCDGDRIYREPTDSIEYFHILFDDHQIIKAHGCWSESFAPHKDAVDAFAQQGREEILKLFPHLDKDWQDALPTLSAVEAAMIAKG
ncbi:MAG: type I secretion protein [Rhodobacteraceae bacterium]|nr:type I secretion protein [Paracoccaceae bacterium]